MRMYLKYLKFSLENAFKSPKKALKVLPGLGFVLAGIVFFVMGLATKPIPPTDTAYLSLDQMKSLGVIYAYVASSFILLITPLTFFTQTGVGFRACDANLFIKGPFKPFESFIFVLFKNILFYIGLSLFMMGSQARGINQLVQSNILLPVGAVLFFVTTFSVSFISYIVLKYKIRQPLLVKLCTAFFIALFILLVFIGSRQSTGIAGFMGLHLLPVYGWNLAVLYHVAFGNITLALIYFGVNIVAVIVLYIVAMHMKFDYYEYELSNVAKTEKRFQSMQTGRNNRDVKLFKQSNKTFKNIGPKVIQDFVIITAGKFWFITLKNVVMFIGLVVAAIIGNFGGIPVYMMAIIPMGIKLYLGSFTTGETSLYTNFYLRLLPIKSLHKIIYLHVVNVKQSILETGLLALGFLVGSVMQRKMSFTIFEICFILMAYFVFSLTECLKVHNIVGFIGVKLGQVLTLICSMVESAIRILLVFGIAALVFFISKNLIIAMSIGFGILVCYLFVLLLISIRIYDKFDMTAFKSENED